MTEASWSSSLDLVPLQSILFLVTRTGTSEKYADLYVSRQCSWLFEDVLTPIELMSKFIKTNACSCFCSYLFLWSQLAISFYTPTTQNEVKCTTHFFIASCLLCPNTFSPLFNQEHLQSVLLLHDMRSPKNYHAVQKCTIMPPLHHHQCRVRRIAFKNFASDACENKIGS